MILERLGSRERHALLFERYGVLLTEHQRRVLGLYLDDDWSLSEIADSQETSRQAVHDILQRSIRALEEYEIKLGLVTRRAAIERELDELRRRLDALTEEVGKI
ncbi:MAG TPA: sigma factor-like helix-turn-helix DNA-binding protein [Candidatus Dormibacteraeota bacterium]|nr:sigma factor-like helix-turn-helix DNA-binding protein [Candidatus Dormibacteraeota bacterium]